VINNKSYTNILLTTTKEGEKMIHYPRTGEVTKGAFRP
jgi:hypothetical protein